MQTKKQVISIAGLDPSAGAGLLADIKTFEANGVYGFGVCSAQTFQNDVEFAGVIWTQPDCIINQLSPLYGRYKIKWVKIGLIQSLEVLNTLLGYLKSHFPGVKIIWDPILSSSSGHTFHELHGNENLPGLCKNLFLITPNYEEIKELMPGKTVEEAGKYLENYCNVLIKGGHNGENFCTDLLFANGKMEKLTSKRLNDQKHGTGCILSAAILANLSKGHQLYDACFLGKEYINSYLQSANGLLGNHNYHNEKTYI